MRSWQTNREAEPGKQLGLYSGQGRSSFRREARNPKRGVSGVTEYSQWKSNHFR